MVDQLLFLGGSSASGKTTAAAHISKGLNLHCVHLDEFNVPLDQAIRAKTIERGPAIDDLSKTIGFNVVEKFLSLNATCLIEGGWLSVPQAAELMKNDRFAPIFCGYPEANADKRWLQIKRSPGHHWLKNHDDVSAIQWIERQIKESQDYRVECETHGVTFVDCSDLENASRNIVSRMYELLR